MASRTAAAKVPPRIIAEISCLIRRPEAMRELKLSSLKRSPDRAPRRPPCSEPNFSKLAAGIAAISLRSQSSPLKPHLRTGGNARRIIRTSVRCCTARASEVAVTAACSGGRVASHTVWLGCVPGLPGPGLQVLLQRSSPLRRACKTRGRQLRANASCLPKMVAPKRLRGRWAKRASATRLGC